MARCCRCSPITLTLALAQVQALTLTLARYPDPNLNPNPYKAQAPPPPPPQPPPPPPPEHVEEAAQARQRSARDLPARPARSAAIKASRLIAQQSCSSECKKGVIRVGPEHQAEITQYPMLINPNPNPSPIPNPNPNHGPPRLQPPCIQAAHAHARRWCDADEVGHPAVDENEPELWFGLGFGSGLGLGLG